MAESNYIKHWIYHFPLHLPGSHPAMQGYGEFLHTLQLLASKAVGDTVITGKHVEHQP